MEINFASFALSEEQRSVKRQPEFSFSVGGWVGVWVGVRAAVGWDRNEVLEMLVVV